MADPASGMQPSEKPPEGRLDSWKEIAVYLGRDVTTVQRWEKREGMPVHRHAHDKRGSVYALASELDGWRQSRKPCPDENEGRPAQREPASLAAVTPEPIPRSIRPIRFRRRLAAAGAAAIVVAAIVYIVVLRSRPAEVAPTAAKIRSLAVLPLKNMSGDPGQEYLADGMTDALIGRLSGIHDLRVISRTSVMRFENPQISVPEIAKTLHVDAIVEGSVMRDGNRIRVTAQLIRGVTDEHFWSETYDRELRDVFGLQSELAQNIAEKVQVSVTGQEQQRLVAGRPVAPETYESYSRGEFALHKSRSKEDFQAALPDFESAIRRDPGFAPAYVGIASVYSNLGGVFIGGLPEEARPKIMSAAKKALELDPNLAEAHVLLANVMQEQWHWTEAEAEYKRALELEPNSASAHEGYALWLASHGRPDEALEWGERGRELDPFAVSFKDFGWMLFQIRHYEQGARELRAALADRPDDFGALMDLGFDLIADNKPQQAIPVLEHAVAISHRSPGALGILVRAYAHAGRRTDALRVFGEMKQLSRNGYVPAGAFVNGYLGLGDNDEALAWLERAYQEQSNMLQFVKVHPYFDPIRSDPRFAELVRRVGLS